MTTYYSCARD